MNSKHLVILKSELAWTRGGGAGHTRVEGYLQGWRLRFPSPVNKQLNLFIFCY